MNQFWYCKRNFEQLSGNMTLFSVSERRSETPGVKGTFHKGYTVWEFKTRVLFSFPNCLWDCPLAWNWNYHIYLYVFFNVFHNCGRFLHYITIEHSNWIETLFAATESKQYLSVQSRRKVLISDNLQEVDATRTALAALSPFIISKPQVIFNQHVLTVWSVCGS